MPFRGRVTKMFSAKKRIGLGALAAATLTIAGPPNSVASSDAVRPSTERELQQAKAATARFHSVKKAKAAGYLAPPPGACVSSPLGGAGYHFANPALMQDTVVDPRTPEILLYERKPSGRFRLVGVEYFMEADRTASTPVLFGRPFEGPMPGHTPTMEAHYDLHVWLFRKNPRGIFEQWNPRVSCP